MAISAGNEERNAGEGESKGADRFSLALNAKGPVTLTLAMV
jgi:hypothetical protein